MFKESPRQRPGQKVNRMIYKEFLDKVGIEEVLEILTRPEEEDGYDIRTLKRVLRNELPLPGDIEEWERKMPTLEELYPDSPIVRIGRIIISSLNPVSE